MTQNQSAAQINQDVREQSRWMIAKAKRTLITSAEVIQRSRGVCQQARHLYQENARRRQSREAAREAAR